MFHSWPWPLVSRTPGLTACLENRCQKPNIPTATISFLSLTYTVGSSCVIVKAIDWELGRDVRFEWLDAAPGRTLQELRMAKPNRGDHSELNSRDKFQDRWYPIFAEGLEAPINCKVGDLVMAPRLNDLVSSADCFPDEPGI